jgi:hypothetical protein
MGFVTVILPLLNTQQEGYILGRNDIRVAQKKR